MHLFHLTYRLLRGGLRPSRSFPWPGALLALTLAGGCGPRLPRYDYRAEPDPRNVQYVLGPGDVIELRQWKNPDVSGRMRVLPDGTITVPLLGQVVAAGLTVKDLRDKLAVGLGKFINQPQEMQTLTVAIDEFQGYAISILGEVNQPGHYQPGHYVTILEALALGHGLTPYARGDQIHIIRRVGGQERSIPVSYQLLTEGRRSDMNLYLLRGDVVVVP
jgi:polysaccharide biosynthesis/export protein